MKQRPPGRVSEAPARDDDVVAASCMLLGARRLLKQEDLVEAAFYTVNWRRCRYQRGTLAKTEMDSKKE